MVTVEQLEKAERQARRAAFQDGSYEILAGFFFLLMSLLLFTNIHLVPFAALLILVFKPITERIKGKWIYPRVGFVQLCDPEKAEGKEALKIVAITASAFVASALLMMASTSSGEGWQTWMNYVMPGLFGVLCAFGPLWSARNQDFVRGYFYAALFPTGSIGLPVSGLALGYDAVAGTCLLVGAFSALIGIAFFTRFLHRNPFPEKTHVKS